MRQGTRKLGLGGACLNSTHLLQAHAPQVEGVHAVLAGHGWLVVSHKQATGAAHVHLQGGRAAVGSMRAAVGSMRAAVGSVSKRSAGVVC